MRKTVVRLVMLVSLLLITGFVVVVANQTAQLVTLAASASPMLGSVVLWTLVTLYIFTIAVPVYLVMSLPKPLAAPATEDDPLFPAHVEGVMARLRRNPHLAGGTITTRAELDVALGTLDAIAVERTKKTASQVFITTAISQNGNLDSFLVLAAQSKLVLEIARTYYQRPTLRDLLYLYSNVAATAFVAGELEDIDLSEQVEPVIGALLGSTASAIPGFGPVMTVFTNSVLTGTANAFLTLRVGVITQQYCRSVVLPPRRALRRTAIAQATAMLGGIALTGSKRVMAAVGAAGKDRMGSVIGTLGDEFRSSSREIADATTAAASAATTGLRDVGASVFGKLGLRRTEADQSRDKPSQP